MSKFTDAVRQDTSRLVVMFRQDGEKELFQWGIVGQLPMITLVGFIVRVQAELAFRAAEECPESALVIVWDAENKSFSWYVHPDIPLDSLVGMLETIKATLVGTHMARQAANQQVILGPDGQPIKR